METANFNLSLSDKWLFHSGELDLIPELPVATSHATSKAGGALKELDMFGEGVKWKEVSVPHDWVTELPFDKNAIPAAGFKNRGTGWYYKAFTLPQNSIESAELVFDGVLGKCEVYVNGVTAARNFSGYNRFTAQIGDYLLPGDENIIAVYVDARRWEGWWYEGAGIYRDVYIKFRENTRFLPEKTFIRSEKSDNKWSIVADFGILGRTPDTTVNITLEDAKQNILSSKTAEKDSIIIPVDSPSLWSPENPYLYTVTLELSVNGRATDKISVKTGLRDIKWHANEGMLLNGKKYPVKGMCCHQDHAGVGAAVTKEIMEYRIKLLKQFGINAYRCAHHQVSGQLLELCDSLGMLVMAENRHFSVSDDVLNQLDSLVLVSRNHPCVFLYSLFNEEPWQAEERGKRIAEKMRERVLSLDNTRYITGAQNGGLLEKANTSDVLDIIGINYALKDYDNAHKRLPDKVLIGTENCPTYATRGVCKSDAEKQIFACYGDQWPEYFSESLTETMNTVYSSPYCGGCFVWSGFDYRGEPTPYEWPSMLSHWGFCDYCGFPKDTAYLLKAWYTNDLCVHLLPHWNHKKGEYVRVCAFTNADTAELFVNGKSVGEKSVSDRICEWNIPFEAGEIKVVAVKDTNTAVDVVKTAEKPHRVKLYDASDSGDVHIINLSVTDENDTLIPDFCEKVEFTLDNLVLLGVGNGNPNSLHDEKANEISFFNGNAQIIVKGCGTLTAKCVSLPEETIKL